VYPLAPYTVKPQTVLVWVNPSAAESNVVRYDLVGYVFRLNVGALAEGTTSPNLFGFLANAVPYDVIVWMTEETARFLLIPLSVRVAQLFKKRSWVRVLFEIHSVARGGLTNCPIEGAPSSLYPSALALDVSHF
jgi:hypothetical protein